MAGLFSLLAPLAGQASLGVLTPDELEAQKYQNGIDVTRNRNVPVPPSTAELSQQAQAPLNLRDLVGPQASAEDYQRSMQYSNLPEHKGMFGVKGTLRDILGTVGDAFLLQSGNNPIYSPQRQRERLSDSLIGFGTGKERDAIARVMAVDPAAGQALYKDWQARNLDNATLDVRREAAQSDAADKQTQLRLKFGNTFGPLLAGATDKASWDMGYKLAQTQANKLGLDLEEDYGIPPDYNEGMARIAGNMGLTRNQQISTGQSQQRIEETGRHNRANESIGRERNQISASRPGPQGRAQTDLEYFKEVGNIPAENRTQAQQDFYKKYTQGTKGRGSGRQSSAPAATSSGPRRVIRQGNNLFDAVTKQYIGPAQ